MDVTRTRLAVPQDLLDPARAVRDVELPGLAPWKRGKVRSIYEAGPEHLVIVASDRLSAYDSVLPTPIPGKGAILSLLSAWWMRTLASAGAAPPRERRAGRVPRALRRARRAAARARPPGAAGGARGHRVRGARLPHRLRAQGVPAGAARSAASPCRPGSRTARGSSPRSSRPPPSPRRGTTRTSRSSGLVESVGRDTAAALRERSLAIYEEARARAWERGLVLADTKFEFGFVAGALTLIDEALTPDSSRYWGRAAYEAGRLLSFDKQFVRDWLDQSRLGPRAARARVARRGREEDPGALSRGRAPPRRGGRMSWPRAALFSLSDQRGAAEFARALAARGTKIVASGGTAKHLAAAGVTVTPVEEWTGFGELLGGRVKTLHPHVHAPILARRSEPADLAALAERGLTPLDLVAVTLYPFEERAGALDEAGAVEEIDIGGVALLRAAAKNFADVIVLHDPAQYAEALAALESDAVTLEQRRLWALRTFARTARYDAAIAGELERRAAPADEDEPPPVHVLALERARHLRYGENPHQPAALYARLGEKAALDAWQEGRELSYNNLLDLEAAVALVGRFEPPACVIVKHGQPCGAAVARIARRGLRGRASTPTSSRPSAGSWPSTARSTAGRRRLDGEAVRRVRRGARVRARGRGGLQVEEEPPPGTA